jgi:uncharacterized protein
MGFQSLEDTSILIGKSDKCLLQCVGASLKIKTLFESRGIVLEPDSPAEQFSPFGVTLVVADLHIGFEEKFRSSGINIESNVEKLASDLETLIDQNKASNLVIAGDVKSGIDRILQSEWENVPKLLGRLARKAKITIVPGNHDGGIQNLVPDSVEVADINGIVVGDTLIIHGHTRPLSKFKDCARILMGHIHPIYQKRGSPLSGMPVWVFARLNKKSLFPEIITDDDSSTIEVIVMPSFNYDLMVSGYAADEFRSERRLAPMVRELKSANEALVTTLNAEVIGDASLLQMIV